MLLFVFFRYPDVVLATLLCIRANLCRRRFEIKVNDMVFVGFPMQMPAAAAGAAASTHTSPNTCSSQPQLTHPSPKREQSSTVSYNIVFAVKVMIIMDSRKSWQKMAKKRHPFVKIAKIMAVYIAANLLKLVLSTSRKIYILGKIHTTMTPRSHIPQVSNKAHRLW